MIMMMIIAMNGDDNIDGDDDCQNTDKNDLDFNDWVNDDYVDNNDGGDDDCDGHDDDGDNDKDGCNDCDDGSQELLIKQVSPTYVQWSQVNYQ